MKKVKVSLLVRGDILCSQSLIAYENTRTECLMCEPDAKIPDKFIKRVYRSCEPGKYEDVEFDLTNAVEITGDVKIESLILKEGSSVVATGYMAASAPCNYKPEPCMHFFPYNNK